MERRDLEDRIRASLHARADDVQPTPELWERVSERTTRRARWQLGGWVLSGAAAVLAIVVGGLVLFGSPRGLQIDPQPDVADTPDQAPVPDEPADTTVVTTDGRLLYVVEPGTGEVVAELDPRAGLQEPASIHEVVVRPVSEDGELTVAMTLELEGEFDVEVAAFDADGQRVDRLNLGMAGSPGTAAGLPPAPVWSADGRYVMWAGTHGPSGPALWAYDWVERPVDADGIAEPSSATPPGSDGELFADGATVDLHTWTGSAAGESAVIASTPTGQAWRIELSAQPSDCAGAQPCPPTWDVAISPVGLEGGSLVDVAVLDGGVELALVARSGQGGDAEGGTLALLAGVMSDQQRELEVPELTAGTAAPNEGWLAAGADQVAVGHGPAAHLLTVSGDTIEDLEVTDTAALPDGTTAADMTTRAAPPGAPSEPETTPTATEDAVAQDGLPAHVIAVVDGGELQLVDRRRPDQPVATWQRPDGVVAEAVPGHVVVHPASTAQDLEVVTRWTVGEAETISRTVVRDGQVLVNEALPADLQPDNQGTIEELVEPSPMFSPTGDWLAWVETPQGADGPVQLRIVPWGDQGPAGNPSTVAVPDDVVRPQELLDWAATPDGDVLTFRPQAGPGEPVGQPAAMVELRLAGADPRTGEWATVELPGVLFDAGSFPVDGGEQRYLAFDGGDEVLYGLAEAPGSAVPTGAFAFSEGRVVAFGPDSALVQQADGSWHRVQVDDGAASSVEVPDGTMATLPWPEEG